jgi:hypothetical protein
MLQKNEDYFFNCLPNVLKNYKPHESRNIARVLKGLLEE